MINIDCLIKFSRQIGFNKDWPEQVNYMLDRLETVKIGFPGISDKHLELIKYSDLEVGDKFIYDPCLIRFNLDDDTPIMYSILENNELKIEGIGYGEDPRDKFRLKKWKDIIQSNFKQDTIVYKVIAKPTETGGPGYYYFFKSYRDFRI